MSLSHSDGIFIKAYPGETTEAFCDGHVSAFASLGGVPQSILYDNTKLAVAKILGGGRRKRTRAFHGVAVALPVHRQVRQSRQGQRQGHCRGHGGIRQEELPGADPEGGGLR